MVKPLCCLSFSLPPTPSVSWIEPPTSNTTLTFYHGAGKMKEEKDFHERQLCGQDTVTSTDGRRQMKKLELVSIFVFVYRYCRIVYSKVWFFIVSEINFTQHVIRDNYPTQETTFESGLWIEIFIAKVVLRLTYLIIMFRYSILYRLTLCVI